MSKTWAAVMHLHVIGVPLVVVLGCYEAWEVLGKPAATGESVPTHTHAAPTKDRLRR